MPTHDAIYEALARVYDPELALPITDLGLIYDVQIDGGRVHVKMTLTTMGCPLAGALTENTRRALLETDGVEDANVELVWDPPWSVDMMSDEARMRLGMM